MTPEFGKNSGAKRLFRVKFGGIGAFSGKIRGNLGLFGGANWKNLRPFPGATWEFRVFFRKKICGIRVYLGTFLVFGKIWAHIHSKGIGFQHCSVSSKAVG